MSDWVVHKGFRAKIRKIGNLYGRVMRNVQIFKYLHCFMDRLALWRKVVMLYGQELECPSQKIEHCQNSIALWTGLLYGQKVVCFMDGIALWTKSGMLYGQQFECPSQKIGHCQNSVALWTDCLWTKSGLLYGRDCFMDGIVLLTKGGYAL